MKRIRCPYCAKFFLDNTRAPQPTSRCPHCRRSIRPGTLPGNERLTDHRCAVCDRLLTQREARSHVCSDPQCRRQHLRRCRREHLVKEAQRLRAAAALRKRLEQLRARVFQQAGWDQAETYPLIVLPAPDVPLVPLPEVRQLEFRAHLGRVIAEAFAEQAVEDADHAPAAAHDCPTDSSPDLPIMASVCATCRGCCCRNGRDQAYLDVPTVGQYLARHPDQDQDQVLETYLSYVPHTSQRNSCIFHAATGCALPGEMRSDICRSFYCNALTDFARSLHTGDEPRAFAVAIHEGNVPRVSVLKDAQMLSVAVEDDRPMNIADDHREHLATLCSSL